MEKIDNITIKNKGGKNFDGIFKKIKSIKNIELIVAAIFIGIILLVFFSGSLFNSANSGDTVTISLADYGNALEKKMENTLSKINGAGKVSVMITFESGIEYITAMTVNSQTNTVSNDYSGGSSKTQSIVQSNSPVIVGGKAVIVKEIEPKVKGVIIVSQGAGSVYVKIELTKAASTLLNIEPKYIEIFQMSK
jgi:stage III sporulation protein AG